MSTDDPPRAEQAPTIDCPREQPPPRHEEVEMPPDTVVKRYLHGAGGGVALRSLSAEERLAYLRGEPCRALPGHVRFLDIEPSRPWQDEPFVLAMALPAAVGCGLSLIRVDVRFPSGKRHVVTLPGSEAKQDGHLLRLHGFQSGTAGELSVAVRLYLEDGSTLSDSRASIVLPPNPHQVVIEPRVWLASGGAGRVEYDWDTDEFHCRAHATITNGTDDRVTYTRCRVRVTDGGADGTLIDEFAFDVGPFTVPPGGSTSRVIDTWYPRGGAVWDLFNQRWDLTLRFTYEAEGVQVSSWAAYVPMSTVPINAIECTNFSSTQQRAKHDAVEIAAEILEARNVTLYGPGWRVIASSANRARYGIIDIGWSSSSSYWDFDEAWDMYEEISGPEPDRLDVFLPLGFAYASNVPADRRNVGGFSTENGPFPKDHDPRRSGCLVLVDENDVEFFGVAIAHEICHYLGLPHVDAPDNLMQANGGLAGHLLTWEQWNTIRQHGMMKWLAPDI